MRLMTSRAEQLADASARAFCLLGTNGPLTVAELTSMMYRTDAPHTAIHAIIALTALGTNGMPALVSAVQDPRLPYPAQLWVVAQVGLYPAPRECAELTTHLLINCLAYTNDANVANIAAIALGRNGLAPQVSVPALFQRLNTRLAPVTVRREAAHSLGLFGRDAVGALPSLTNAMTDPDPLVRLAATNAIRDITSRLTDIGSDRIRSL